MWELEYTTQFKKDLKRYKHQSEKIAALKNLLLQLKETGMVDWIFRPHMLSGEYTGCVECHIQNDFLLIWMDKTEYVIKLVRLGSHSELFK